MLRQFAHELRQVRARFHEVGNPAKARGSIASAQRFHHVAQVAGVHPAQHALGNLKRYLAFAKRNHLLKRGERVAHAAASMVRNQIQRVALELHAFRHAHRA